MLHVFRTYRTDNAENADIISVSKTVPPPPLP